MENLNIKQVNVSELIPYVNNAKIHHDEQVTRIAASIKEFGFNNPILTDGSKGIIAGHGRLMAAKKLGLDTVPVIELSHLSEAQKKGYILADNRLSEIGVEWDMDLVGIELQGLADLDFDVELTGFDLADFDLGGEDEQKEGLTDDDEVPELPEEPITKPGDLWILGEHRLLCGDSTKADDVARVMGGEKAVLVITDPPYGVSYADKNAFLNQIDKGNCVQTKIENDHATKEQTQAMWKAAFTEMGNAMDKGAVVYCFMPQGGDQMMMMMMMMGAGIEPRHELIWVKNNHVLGRTDYAYKHEPILYAWKDGGHKFYGDFQTSLLEYPRPNKSDLHPTMKPVPLIERLIANSSMPSGIIYEPFSGSGTTIIACEKLNRKCRAIELSPRYVDVAVKRWEDYTGKKAVLDGRT